MDDTARIRLLQDALNEARQSLLVVLSPKIDAQLPPERRKRAHAAIDTAKNALTDTGYVAEA